MTDVSAVERALVERFVISAHDIPTRDKIPVIRQLMVAEGKGLALDIGSGTGYTTSCIFGDRQTVCVDLHAPNLHQYLSRLASIPNARQPLCVVAQAVALPFKAGVFRFILCSEVIEHLENDDAAVRELTRVLSSDGRAVITVPYTGMGFTSFLELCGIKTVHDFPGPEHHVRPGYDEDSLRRLLTRHGLEIIRHTHYLRFFTRLATDLQNLGHLLYQRVIHRRRSFTWSEAEAAEGSLAFRLYTCVFPVLWAFSRIDRLLRQMRGFGLIISVRNRSGGGTAGGIDSDKRR